MDDDTQQQNVIINNDNDKEKTSKQNVTTVTPPSSQDIETHTVSLTEFFTNLTNTIDELKRDVAQTKRYHQNPLMHPYYFP